MKDFEIEIIYRWKCKTYRKTILWHGQFGEGEGLDDDANGRGFEIDSENNGANDEDNATDEINLDVKWLVPIDISVLSTTSLDRTGKPMKVACCKAKLIARPNNIRQSFYDRMAGASRLTRILAFELFDRYGCLKPQFKENPVFRGTGIWGRELGRENILLIEHVLVNKEYRRQGLGQMMINSVFTTARNLDFRGDFFSSASPTCLGPDNLNRMPDSPSNNTSPTEPVEDHEPNSEYDRTIRFFRAFGFLRVGFTKWFAMSSNPEHRSNQFDFTYDVDPKKSPSTPLHPLLSLFQSTLDEESDWKPCDDRDWLGMPHECMQQVGPADACWMSKGSGGTTLLHLAALISSPSCIEWILNQEFGPPMLRLRNDRAETPVESLQSKLASHTETNQLTDYPYLRQIYRTRWRCCALFDLAERNWFSRT